jgi:colanic acid biosynthesis glycosyl transferase WcaI
MTTLLYSGNLGIGQDLHTVLRAVARFNGDMDLHILIVGGGKGLTSVKQLAAELQLRNIEFGEPVPLYKLAELLASGDIHIICQKRGTEGLLVPSKVYGTLVAGRPSLFVGPHNCEVGRIIHESQSGFIVEPGDIEGVSNALKSLVLSSTLREKMGENARKYYRLHFGRKDSLAKIISIIEHGVWKDYS